jgi:hypothetical protein
MEYCVTNFQHLGKQMDTLLKTVNDLKHTRRIEEPSFDPSFSRGLPVNSLDELDKLESSVLEGPNSVPWRALVW